MCCQIDETLEFAAKDSGRDLTWWWPLFGLSDSDARPEVQCSTGHASAVITWHMQTAAVETAKKQLMPTIGKATAKVKSGQLSDDDDNLQKQVRAAVTQAIQAKKQGERSKGA